MKKGFLRSTAVLVIISILMLSFGSLSQAATKKSTKVRVRLVNASAQSVNSEGSHLAKHTIDGILNQENPDNFWSAEGKGHWIKYQFDKIKTVTSLKVQWHAAKTQETWFAVYTSTDNKKWTKVRSKGLSHQKTGTDADLEFKTYKIKPIKAKYLKIMCYGNTSEAWSGWNSICEVEIYGY